MSVEFGLAGGGEEHVEDWLECFRTESECHRRPQQDVTQWGQCLDTDWAEPRVQSDLYLMRLQCPPGEKRRVPLRVWELGVARGYKLMKTKKCVTVALIMTDVNSFVVQRTALQCFRSIRYVSASAADCDELWRYESIGRALQTTLWQRGWRVGNERSLTHVIGQNQRMNLTHHDSPEYHALWHLPKSAPYINLHTYLLTYLPHRFILW